MLLKPHDAAGKICPQMSWADKTVRCQGPDCMFWRWGKYIRPARWTYSEADRYDRNDDDEPPRPSDVPADWIWRGNGHTGGRGCYWEEPEATAALDRTGFCGAAGEVLIA